MNFYVAVFLIIATVTTLGISTVSGQTFQYSRGWTNGKRSGMNGNMLYESNLLDKLLSNPCQLEKLKYILQGKPLNEKLMVPCDLLSMNAADVEAESSGMRLKRSPPSYDARSFN